MKKFFLSMAALAVSAASMFAQDSVTFSFTGNADVYGLTRTSKMVADIPSPTVISQDNITVELASQSGDPGFYLYTGGYLGTSGTNTLTFTTSNGATITEVQVLASRIMGAITCPEGEGAVAVSGQNRIWTGESKNLVLTVTGTNRLTGFKITYEGGGATKASAGLSFEETSYEVVEGNAFEAPVLANPNNLTVSWSSSDENVATVDAEGMVTVVGAGKTVINATSEETDAYLAGKASYTLTVIPVVKTVAELVSKAAVLGDQAYIDMPLTVVYNTPIAMYVVDAEGNATRLNIGNNLKVGNVIPAGWMATNSNASNYVQYKGTLPSEITEVVEVTYPEVETITTADNNRVVTLMNVTFAETTEEDNSMTFVGTLADGSDFTFKNQFMVGAVDAGTYNVTLAVKAWYSSMYDKDMFELNPISYVKCEEPYVPELVEKSDLLDLTVLDMPATSTPIPADALPRTYQAKNFTYTLVSGSNTTAPFRERATQGIMLPKGEEVMTLKSEKNISKVVIATGGSLQDWNTKVGDIKGNDILFEYDEDTDPVFILYTWTAPEGEEVHEVNIVATAGQNAWMRNITMYYMEETSGLPLAELSLTQTSATVSKAESPLDASVYVVNPHAVPLKWTSSDESIAVPTAEGIELKAAGTVTLTAAVNSDEYEPQEVDITLIVVDAAMDIEQMSILAPEVGDKVQIYNSLALYLSSYVSGTYKATVEEDGEEKTVTYYESYMFMEDKTGKPVLFHNYAMTTKPGYRVDDMFGGGYTVTNVSEGDLVLWKGLPLNDSRAMGWFDNRKSVESLAGVEYNKIVILKNVSLASGVPAAKGEFAGSVDGDDLTLYNLVNGTKLISGVYDILGAPGVSPDGKLVFFPVEYTFVSDLAPEFPETLNVTTDSEHVTVSVEYDEDYEMNMINISGTTSNEDGLKVTVEVPAGWSNVLSMIRVMDVDYGLYPVVKKAAPAEWVPVSNLTEEGAVLGNVITIPNKPAMGGIYLVYDDKADMANYYALQSNVTYEPTDPSAVEVIEAVDADAVYYSLQGVEVKNPANGIYVKVLNGKATKVAIK